MQTSISTLLKHSADPILLTDQAFRIIECNQQTVNYFNIQRKKIEGKNIEQAFGIGKEILIEIKDNLEKNGMSFSQNLFGNYLTTFFKIGSDNEARYLMRLSLYHDSNYQSLFEKNLAGVYRIEVKGIILDCNFAFAKILGFEGPHKLIGQDIASFYDNPKQRDKIVKKLLTKGVLSNQEIKLVRKDGSIAWCLENSFTEKQGKIQSINGTLIDITKSKEATEKFQQLFDQSADAILLLDGTRIIDCNPRSIELFSRPKKKLLGMDILDFKNGIVCAKNESKTNVVKNLKEILELGGTANFVCRGNNEIQFHAHWSVAPMRVGENNLTQAVIRDESDREKLDASIRESETRFKLLSNVAIESIVFLSTQNKIIDCNSQFPQLLGYVDNKDVIGKNLADFIQPPDLTRLRRTSEVGNQNKFEIRAKNKNGETIFLEATATNIKYKERDVMVMLFYDITNRKRTEQALGQSMDRFKNLVENSPNGIFIIAGDKIKYVNWIGAQLLGSNDEDELYNKNFFDFIPVQFTPLINEIIYETREGEDTDYVEIKIKGEDGKYLDVGFKANLTVYENLPSVQVTLSNLSTRIELLHQEIRAQLAEEINEVLRKEIKEHKITQAKLMESQTFTNGLINSSLDMIIAANRDGDIVEFNESALSKFEISKEEALSKNVKDFFADDSKYTEVIKALSDQGHYSGEILSLNAKGETFLAMGSISLIKRSGESASGVMGILRDITEIKENEKNLKESEARYRDLFDHAKDMIISFDKKGKFIYANKSFREALKLGDEINNALSIMDLVKKNSMNKRKSLFRNFEGTNLEVVFIGTDGEEVIAEGEASIGFKDKKEHNIRAIFKNVTESRKKERDASENRAKLEAIFNSTQNLMMWTLDNKMKITTFNKNFGDYLRINHNQKIKLGDSMVGTLKKLTNPDLYQNQLDYFKKAWKGTTYQFELPLLDTNGNNIWLQIFLNPVYIGKKMEELSCLAYDITERITIEKSVRDSLKEKEVLLQEVHHRVKNNLQVISSILNLQSSFVDDEKTLQILEESQNRIKSMSYIHETLYRTADFSSIEFTEYIRTLVVNLVQSYSIARNVALIMNFEKVFIPLDKAIPCGLIVNELVSNAMKYAYDGIKKPTLTLEIGSKSNEVTMKVSDNGIGLPEDFNYAESDSLGVQLVYALVDQLDGKIKIMNEKGTAFVIKFSIS